MKYKVLGYTMLGLLLAAIVSLTLVYQLRRSIRVEPVVHIPKQTSSNPECGGIAGLQCPDNLTCVLEATYPDAGGKCVSSK